jgi:hypothetical protein
MERPQPPNSIGKENLKASSQPVDNLFCARSEHSPKPGTFGKPTFAVFESDELEELSLRLKLVVD